MHIDNVNGLAYTNISLRTWYIVNCFYLLWTIGGLLFCWCALWYAIMRSSTPNGIE